MIVIVAFLQCQWFKDAKRAAKIYSLYGKTPDGRAELNGRYLFFRSKTGRVLRECLGQDLCDRIIWEESTTRLADQSTGAFTPDPQHMRVVLDHFSPKSSLPSARSHRRDCGRRCEALRVVALALALK